jgi:hypothetical protein
MDIYSDIRKNCHLFEPIIEKFAKENSYLRPLFEGRYPSFRVYQELDELIYWMHFSMGVDANGNRFITHNDDLPYEFFVGITCDMKRDIGIVRHTYVETLWEKKTALAVKTILLPSLLQGKSILNKLDRDFLLNNSKGVLISNRAN